MVKILVTGGAGFIGSHVVDELIEKGYDVVVIDNLSTGKQNYVNSNAVFYKKDILDPLDFIFEKEKPDIVIHMAAQAMLRSSLEDPIYDARVNILGAINVLEACRKFGIKKIVYTSTGGARVGEPKYLPVDEKHEINPISPYGISKHTVEHYIKAYSKIHGFDYLILCFGNVYGPRDDPNSKRAVSMFAYEMLKGKIPVIFGDGNQTRDFIYVKDLASFIAECIEKNPENKLFHLANGEQVSINQIFNILKKIIGFNQNAKYLDAIKGEVRDIVFDISLVKKELEWNPKTSLYDGLKETVEWFKQ